MGSEFIWSCTESSAQTQNIGCYKPMDSNLAHHKLKGELRLFVEHVKKITVQAINDMVGLHNPINFLPGSMLTYIRAWLSKEGNIYMHDYASYYLYNTKIATLLASCFF